MIQRFSRPDLYVGRCGHLDAVVTAHILGGAPPFMRGLRLLFAADLHVPRRATGAELDALVDRIAAAGPRLLLLGGDYSDDAEGCVRFFEALGRVRFPLGCFGVIGNNDAEAWEGNEKGLREAMAAGGCRLLLNQSANLPLGGGVLRIGGVDEYRFGHPHPEGLWRGKDPGNSYRILLSHYPVLPAQRPDLMLCGHTHGGQFNLLGLTPYAIGFERFNRPRRASAAIAGLRNIDGMKLLVTKGVGASRLQWRVGVRPEVNLVTFA